MLKQILSKFKFVWSQNKTSDNIFSKFVWRFVNAERTDQTSTVCDSVHIQTPLRRDSIKQIRG